MNRRSILELFLSSPFVGITAVAVATELPAKTEMHEIRERVMVHISDEMHMLEADGFTVDDIARWYSLPNHRYLEIKSTLAAAR